MKRSFLFLVSFAIVFLMGFVFLVPAQQQARPFRHQHRQGAGTPAGQSGGCCMGRMNADMPVIHELLDGHTKISRQFRDIPNGIESWTESEDPKLVPLIQQHVAAMERRLKEGSPIHQRDPHLDRHRRRH